MKPIKTVTVKATLPEKISDLQGLAYNLCWTWNHEAMDLFQRIDPNCGTPPTTTRSRCSASSSSPG